MVMRRKFASTWIASSFKGHSETKESSLLVHESRDTLEELARTKSTSLDTDVSKKTINPIISLNTTTPNKIDDMVVHLPGHRCVKRNNRSDYLTKYYYTK